MASAPKPAPRPRDAAATRAAILAAARKFFTRDGYERVGVRDVASDAGVNAALVIRYFGSKDGLFAEAVAHEFDVVALLGTDRSAAGERLARHVLTKPPHAGGYDPLLMILRSSGSKNAIALIADALETKFVTPLAGWIGGPDAEVRAGLIAAYLLGLDVMHKVIGSTAVVSADRELFIALVAAGIQALIDPAKAPRSSARVRANSNT